MSLKEIAGRYFGAFSQKNLISLENFFADSVSLRDWDVQAQGKTDVLNVNKSIFEQVESIQVTPLKLYEEQNVVIGELEVLINKSETLKVVDVIEFDEFEQIISIRAYKG